jgi:hypothetical protein
MRDPRKRRTRPRPSAAAERPLRISWAVRSRSNDRAESALPRRWFIRPEGPESTHCRHSTRRVLRFASGWLAPFHGQSEPVLNPEERTRYGAALRPLCAAPADRCRWPQSQAISCAHTSGAEARRSISRRVCCDPESLDQAVLISGGLQVNRRRVPAPGPDRPHVIVSDDRAAAPKSKQSKLRVQPGRRPGRRPGRPIPTMVSR